MNQNLKTYIGFAALSALLVVCLFAQANLPVPPLPPEGQANIFTAMYDTIIHNPSSLFVLIVLCVFAWLMDTLPFVNSKYVTHFSTLLGGSIYWMFCHPANVPKSFPYAWPVLACIGFVCGFVAGVLHKQIIGRAIEYARSKIPGSEPKTETKSNTTPLGLLLLSGFLSFGLVGCAATQRAPSAIEQKYYDVKTNVVEVVALVTNKTEATATTPAVVTVTPVTNLVEQYDFTPNQTAQLTAQTGAAVGSVWNPVAGGVVGAVITGLFSLWGLFRSKKRATANEITSVELGQIIETGRQIMLQLPDGAKYEAAWKAWMVKHQAEAGVIGQVAELVKAGVDNDKAKGAAQTLVNLIQAQSK